MVTTNQTQARYFNPGESTTVMPQTTLQYPYTQQLVMNTPYDNYMNRGVQQNQFLKCRPVSSKEEAMAFQIDLDGSLWVFPNVANGKIYTKQINNDGTASFRTYLFTEEKAEHTSEEYVTKNEFNKMVQSLMAIIQNNNNENNKVVS